MRKHPSFQYQYLNTRIDEEPKILFYLFPSSRRKTDETQQAFQDFRFSFNFSHAIKISYQFEFSFRKF